MQKDDARKKEDGCGREMDDLFPLLPTGKVKLDPSRTV
jgi:hypothetical protein